MNDDQLSSVAPGPYGRDFARKFGAEDAPSIVTRSLKNAAFAATEVRVDHPNGEMSEPIPPEDAHLFCLVFRDLPNFSYWSEGREYGRYSHRAGEITISDLRRQPTGRIDRPLHSLLMYLPRRTMNVLTDQASLPRVENLRFEPGGGIRDEIIWSLGLSLLPALQAPEHASRLFVDHLGLALAGHAAYAYGGQQILRPIQGGLAPWQERRAKDMILGDLTGNTSLGEIASACGLSEGYLTRAFRKTTGFTPHAWLLRARVQQATVLLRRHDAALGSVARACGFADQSHFSRVFTRHTGLRPSVWRRLAAR